MDWEKYWEQILGALDANPPDGGDWAVRESAFLAIDRVFQDREATGPGGEQDLAAPDGVIERVFEYQLRRALERIAAFDGASGVQVTQLYDSGYIVAADGLRVGFDLKYPSRNDPWSFGWDADPALEEALAGACDVLFVSHDHSDHADSDVWGRALEMGRHLVSPVTLRSANARHVRLDQDAAFEVAGVSVRSYRSPHVYDPEGATLHLSHEVTFPGGFRVHHSGDLDHTRAAPRSGEPIDLLALKTGGVSPEYDDEAPDSLGGDEDAFRLGVAAFEPAAVLCAHVGELGHAVGGGRERFGMALSCARSVDCPCAVLFWGETLVLR